MKVNSPFVLFSATLALAVLPAASARAAEIFVTSVGSGAMSDVVGAYSTTGETINASLIGGLFYPYGVAMDGGNLFVASEGNQGTLGEYTADGGIVNASLLPGVGDGMGLAVSDGGIFLAKGGANIPEYTTAGTFVTIIRPPGRDNDPGPFIGIAVSGADLFVTSWSTPNSVSEFTTSGATLNPSLISNLNYPEAIAVSGNDLFIVSNNGTLIGEYTTSGATVNATLITGLNGINGLAVYGGDLFVTNGGFGGAVSEYTTSGALVNASLVTGLGNPVGIVVVPEPATWVMLAIGAGGLLVCGRRKRRSRV